MEIRNAYSKKIEELFNSLKSGVHGITESEAKKRLEQMGANKLLEAKVDTVFDIFLHQFQSPLIYILLVAAGIVIYMGEVIDASIILIVLFFNAIVGSIQEGKAQNTMMALRKFSETKATVLRDGKEIIIDDSEVVPGDIIILQEGEKVPADSRIIHDTSLRVDEAPLTGESEPVIKSHTLITKENTLPADQKNMLFKGTNILAGNATALVVATGSNTEIGKIALEISKIDTEIPLKKNIKYLSRLIIITVALVSVLIVVFGTLGGRPLKEMFTTAVALAVSIIPEGLPIVLTLVLATGVWRMSKRNALVKRLQAVESLGQTKIIAVDKTGTLTENQMVLQKIYTASNYYTVTGEGYEPKGSISQGGNEIEISNIKHSHKELYLAAKVAAYSANARLSYVEDKDTWKVAGDPTEAAMLVYGEKIGMSHENIAIDSEILYELPFDYKRRFHAVVRKNDGKQFLSVTGAPEKVMELCKKIIDKTGIVDFTHEKMKEAEKAFSQLASEGFRVIAFAMNTDAGGVIDFNKLPEITFGGFYAIKDALRPEVKEVVKEVRAVGIKMVMITGDHKVTAEAIAREAGIWNEGDKVLTGEEIEKMNEFELAENLSNVSVFARVTPDHKLRIIEAYRKRGEVVAMTGDGVNDAPSLVAADLGVAMGKIGTEVAKEAADIILLDDNFGSIVAAAEEGRSIYKTIKKVILYLFSTSAGEVFVIVGAMILLLPLPILPSQIIWLNFVTDGFLVVALAMEPKESGLLRGVFAKPKKWIVDELMGKRIFLMASVMTIGSLYLFSDVLFYGIEKAWSVSLTILAVYQWFNAWNCRSETESIFKMNPFSNMYLVGATITVILLHFAALYVPFMQQILKTQPLTLDDWIMIIPLALTIVIAEEIRKFLTRRKLGTAL